MSLFRHVRALLDVRTPTTDNQDGNTWMLIANDPDVEPRLDLRIWVQPDPDPTLPTEPECATAPVAQAAAIDDPEALAEVVVETSVDRIVWMPIHAPFPIRGRPALSPVVVVGPYVRARTLSHGKPHTVRVKLLGNGSFRVEPT